MGRTQSLSLSLRILMPLAALLFLLGRPATAADADPIFDYCVADLSATSVFFNGLPCKNPATLDSGDFKSSAFRGMGNTSNPLGIAIAFAAAGATFPALNTQGLTVLRIDYASGGFVPFHVHQRTSEVIFVQKGAVLVGFIDTAGKFFSSTLYPGDLFIFPRGLIHFQLSSSAALTFSSLNSQNPGLSLVASALFASTPGIPSTVLEKTFAITPAEVASIKAALGGH